MFTQEQLPSQHRYSHDDSFHHSTGDVHSTTAVITSQEMFTQQLPSQHRCSHNSSCHYSTGDVHTTAAATTVKNEKEKNVYSNYSTDVHTITATITAQHTRSNIKWI